MGAVGDALVTSECDLTTGSTTPPEAAPPKTKTADKASAVAATTASATNNALFLPTPRTLNWLLSHSKYC